MMTRYVYIYIYIYMEQHGVIENKNSFKLIISISL